MFKGTRRLAFLLLSTSLMLRSSFVAQESAPQFNVALPWDPASSSGTSVGLSVGPALPLSSTAWTALGPAPISNGQRPGNGPVSGRLAGMAADPIDPNTIYIAAAGGGVWKTTDGGTNWVPLTDQEATLSMGAIAVAPSNRFVLYAGTGEANNSGDSNFGRGVLVSVDGGGTWTLRNNGGAFDRKTVSEIAIDPSDANVAYVAIAGGGVNGLGGNTGIWKTTDGAATWTNTTASITSTQAWSSVRIDPNNSLVLYAAVGSSSGSSANGVYKSVNGGSNWSLLAGAPSGTVAGRIVVAVGKTDSQVLYVSATGTGSGGSTSFGSLYKFMRSDNGGTTFTDLTATPNYLGGQGWYDTTLIVDPANAAIVYAGGAAGSNSIMRSANSGANWTDITTGPSGGPHVDHHAAGFDAAGRYLDGNDGGLYRLDNPSSVVWTQLNGNLSTIQFQGVGMHPTDVNTAFGGSQDNGTSRYSGTQSWTLSEGGDGGLVRFSRTNSLRVYHQAPVASFGSASFFRRSDNGGLNWTSRVTGITDNTTSLQNFYSPFVVDPNNGDRVLYGAAHVWESTNGGDLWTALGAAFPSNVTAIGLSTSDINSIYASASNSTFFTNNHGATWNARNLPVTGRVSDIAVDPSDPLTAYAVVSTFSVGGNVFRTVNGGVNWTNITSNLPAVPTWSVQLDAAASVLYVGTDIGVYRSVNSGASWTRFGSGFPNAQVFQLELNPTTHILGAATHGRGAWEILVVPQLTISKTHTGDFSQGQVGATYTVTVGNNGTTATSETVTVTEVPPAGLTVTDMQGTGWTCNVATLICHRVDALPPGSSYPAITVTVNVSPSAPSTVTNEAQVVGGGDPSSHSASDPTTIIISGPVVDLTVSKTHTETFRQGQIGALYSITVSNIGSSPSSGQVTLTDVLPPGLSIRDMSGSGWSCTPATLTCQRSDSLSPSTSYPAITLSVDVASDSPLSVTNTAQVSGGSDSVLGNNSASDLTLINPKLRFIPVTPCRVADTRNPAGPLGGPFLTGNATRAFPIPTSPCGIPSNAKAYSLNATVVPHGTLNFLTLWPTGQPQPLVSTLNANNGQITANAAIVPAGFAGLVSAFVTDDTDLILDINGYFLDTTSPTSLVFYPLPPCRVADTRDSVGPLGGPILPGSSTRSFPVQASSCGIPATAQAYALNATVVPTASLSFLTLWPSGSAQPFVSTLNSFDEQITANMAIVPAGTGGSVDAFVTDSTHLILDITGYFAPPATGGLSMFRLPPCRVLDTRSAIGPLGGPILGGGTSRSFPVLSSSCGIPSEAQAYSMNATVVPPGSLGYLTVWPTGLPQPFVSTLNSLDGQITANALIVPSGTGGAIDAFVTDSSDIIVDINGYFAP